MSQPKIRFAFAGDRDIAVWVLEFLLQNDYRPEALLVSSQKKASHAEELKALCSYLPQERIFNGTKFKKEDALNILDKLRLDYIIGIHFPYIIPKKVLNIPSEGVINLHPAYLPYNRGWHTPTWAILEGTPVGATLHFMAEAVDSGDIIYQEKLEVLPSDTAHTLYKKLKKLELKVFIKSWPSLVEKSYQRIKQDIQQGTSHLRKDLFESDVQNIQLSQNVPAGDLIRKLRALTTSDISEAACFEKNDKRYRIQVRIEEDIKE